MVNATKFKAEEVNKIYMGADRACRCGCKGKYVNRGEPMFDKRLARFVKLWETYEPTADDIDSNFLNITTSTNGEGRALTVYFD